MNGITRNIFNSEHCAPENSIYSVIVFIFSIVYFKSHNVVENIYNIGNIQSILSDMSRNNNVTLIGFEDLLSISRVILSGTIRRNLFFMCKELIW